MAGSALRVIDVLDLSQVWGGVDKQTAAAQRVIDGAVRSVEDLARATAPKDDTMNQVILQMLSKRGGSGPTPAPALPPTSTLAR